MPSSPAAFQDFPFRANSMHLLACNMAGHAEQSPEGLGQSYWHTSREWSAYPQETKGVVHIEGLEHRRAHSDPIPHLRTRSASGWLRHIDSTPVDAANVIVNDGTRPTVPAGSRQPEPFGRSSTGNTRGDSDGAHAAIGKPLVVHQVCTAPKPASESSVEHDSLRVNAQTLTRSSAGSMKIALTPPFTPHQHTSVPTQHATRSISHKSPSRPIKSHSQPRLTINIPQKQTDFTTTVIDMATSQGSPSPTKKTSRPREKRVSFSTLEPEIIPAPSKRRQSSVNQRPSWSNVFLLRESKVRDDVAARSRSLSPGPSILKEFSAFKSDATDAELKQDEHGNEHKVHVSPLYEKNLKRLSRGRPKTSLPIPQAKVSRNASPRAMSPDQDFSPTSLSARHASPREDTFDNATSEHHSVVVHPPSPPESDAEDDDEDVIEDSDEQSPRHSRNSSLDDVNDDVEVEAIDSRFSKCDIDGSSHAHRHEPRRNPQEGRKSSNDDWRTLRKTSNASRSSNDDWRTSRKSSNRSRKDSQESNKSSEKPPTPRRRSSSADQAEMWLRRSSIYGVRSSRTPRVPTRLGSLRA